MDQYPARARTLIAASYGDSASIAEPLREAVRALDPNMPIHDVRTMEEFFQMGLVGQHNLLLNTVGAMGFLAFALATIGLYGLVDYSVSCRTREFGIRMAIGASRGLVRTMVLRQGMMLAAAGVTIGVVTSWPASNLLKWFVFSANTDWMPFIAVPILLVCVTLLAAYGPARRASRIDPMKALRYE